MASLGDVGLSEYEARVYRALLRSGPATAKELSAASDVPMGRIYDVLNGLESTGIVRSQDAGRPKRYAPVEPETAFDRLLERKREQLDVEFRQYQQAVEELEERLETNGPDGEQFWNVAVGPDDSVDLLVDRLGATTERIVMVASEPVTGFDFGSVGERVAAQIEAALERGVDVSILAAPGLIEAVPAGVARRYERIRAAHDGYEVRVSEDIAGTFNLLDSAEVCIEVRNPLDEGEVFALIDLTDPGFAENVHEEFRPRWEDAVPLQEWDR